jgi:hypothetical protein
LSPFAGGSPTAPLVDPPAALAALAAPRREFSGAVASLASPAASNPSSSLIFNKYEIVPGSSENVISFYGLITVPPALPGSVQGTQEFNVVDPDTGATVGSFEALVSNTNSFVFGGGTLMAIYVTGVADDADPAATPAPGTFISQVTFGKKGRTGFQYTAVPSDPRAETSLKLLTPLGDIRIPFRYDVTKTYSEVNRPLELTRDYYIAPAPGYDQTFTSISGVTPGFTAMQGEQVFAVYQKTRDGVEGNDVVIGTFKGYVTTTSDAIGTSTEAILVTEVLSGTEGTGPGDVPSVGSIYNVIYHFGIMYSSIPSDSGDVVTTKLFTVFGDIKMPITWSASSPPVYESFPIPDTGYSLVPVGTMQTSGINGLPPREVQVQGYQRFNVVDSTGAQVGSFDAQVTYQWSLGGGYNEAVLVTNVTDGTPGTDAGQIPPIGSQLNFVYSPLGGLGMFYSAMPSDAGDVLTFKILTGHRNITIPARYNAIKGLGDVTYYDPFAP